MINRAKTIAIAAHSNQSYGAFPYVVHLAAVEEVISRFGFGGDVELRSAAWLHDILEDTELTLEAIKLEFGEKVANVVWAVTDGEGRNRKERKAAVYPKIRQIGSDALIVKLADRIANIEAGGKTDMYRKENPAFKNELYNGLHEEMWSHIDFLLAHQDISI